MLHTFQGGCKNDDCRTQGDRVCDTPPDNSTGPLPCGGAYNSCHTDTDDPSPQNPFRDPALGGLGDQNDMHRNYMDYSPYECYDRFTEGQKVRMRFFIETLRAPLLASKACLPPCPQPTTALFTVSTEYAPRSGPCPIRLTNSSS
ncbi:MAG: M43 family zinc metalloprotease [Saprospiraceae bacterium]